MQKDGDECLKLGLLMISINVSLAGLYPLYIKDDTQP